MRKLIVSLIAFIGLSGCSLVVSPVVNSVNVDNLDYSNVEKLKSGEACGTYLLGFIGPFGAPSLMGAIKNGDISKVYAVENESGNYILFSNKCVVVYGE